MLTDRTDAKLAHGIAALRLAQLIPADAGEAEEEDDVPMPGQVSRRRLAMACGVSCDTLARFERGIFEQIAAALEGDLTPEEAVTLCQVIDDPDSFSAL